MKKSMWCVAAFSFFSDTAFGKNVEGWGSFGKELSQPDFKREYEYFKISNRT